MPELISFLEGGVNWYMDVFGSNCRAEMPETLQPDPAAEAEARDQALLEWRRIDTREVEGAWKTGEKAMADIVPKVLNGLRLEQRVAETQIVQLWKQLIDPAVVAHAQPTGLVRGTLFVNVDSNAWLSEIVRYRRHEILERLQLAVGKAMIQKISFRVGG